MMKRLFTSAISAGLTLGVWLALDGAAADKRSVQEMPAAVAEMVTGPRLAGLESAFAKQAAAWEGHCQSLDGLREAFNEASDAWARMEPFASGPLSRKSRRERISYWPDPRNAVARGLNALLNGEGESGLTPQNMADASVAAQGLPALERLLFSQDGSSGAPDALSARECAVGQAISRNLRAIAADALAEWSEPELGDLAKIRATLTMPDKAGEAASAVLGDVATGLRVMEDRKIPPLFGGKGAVPDEKKAESWRSHRGARDLLLNVEALQAALKAIVPFAPEAAAAANEKLADAAAALADPNDPNRGVNVIAAINNAKYYVIDVLPGELGVALGFNSMDGD